MWRLARPDAAMAMEDPMVRRSLPRYVDIVKKKRQAKFIILKSMAVDFDLEADTEHFWKSHSRYVKQYLQIEQQVDSGSITLEEIDGRQSFLDLKVELGKRIMTSCHFCVRRCGSNRLNGEKGYCRCDGKFAISSSFPHMGEEPELVPSGTIFTCGCSMQCIHCQNWRISQWGESGTPVGPSSMAGVVDSLQRQGCRNVNMVGGDPTPNCWLWLKTMQEVDASIATVWNSNSYYSQETAELLAGFIDLYLLDFKYGNNACAEAISDAPRYWEACTRNHVMAKKYGELIVRVLVLPGHNDCCTRPILQWIAENIGPWTRVNLMFQYRPEWRARERVELSRRLTQREIDEAKMIAEEVGLRNLVH